MQARCPHCQGVFATGEPGLQACPQCGKQVNVPDLRSERRRPLDPYASDGHDASAGEEPLREPTDWERRGELGFLKGLLGTLKASVLAPSRFWRSVRPDGPLLDALLWGWIITALGAVVQLPFALADGASFVGELDQIIEQFAARGMGEVAARVEDFRRGVARFGPTNYMLALVASRAIFFPLFAVASAGVLHLGLLIFGGARGGFLATFRAFCYASAPWLLTGVPVLGFFSFLWFLVLLGWGLRAVHAASTARILLAFGAPLLLICCCLPCLAGTLGGLDAVRAGGQVPVPEKTIELRRAPLDFEP